MFACRLSLALAGALVLGANAAAAQPAADADPGSRGDPGSSAVPNTSADARARAESEYERGRKLYAARDYAGAATAFDAAYRASPEARFLYNRAQAERLSGDCDAAAKSYEAFIATKPDVAQRDKAQGNLEHCQTVIAKRNDGVPSPAPAVSPPTRVPTPAPPGPIDNDYAPPFYADVAGGVLLGSGLVLGAVGGGLLGWSFSLESDAEQSGAATYQAHEEAIAQAEDTRVAGIVLVSTGAALFVGALVRYGVVIASTAPPEPHARASCTFVGALRCTF